MAPNFARVDTAAARIGALSRITRLKIYLIYLAGFVAFGPSTPVKYRRYEYNLCVFCQICRHLGCIQQLSTWTEFGHFG